MYQIEINDTQSRLKIDLKRLEAVAVDVLSAEQVDAAEVSIALIDGQTMRRLNREHLGHDYDTDVLSFLLDCRGTANSVSTTERGAGKTIDGEVLISTDVAALRAAEFGWSAEDELILYLVHGLLHLVGYDDLTDTEKAIIRQRERAHLARWGLKPVYAEAISSETAATDQRHELSSGVRG